MHPQLSSGAAIAAQLDAARLARTAVAAPVALARLSVADAYDVQDALAACRESAGGRPAGWKLGLTSAVKQRLMGIDRPVFGRLFADGAVANRSYLMRSRFIAPRVEPELAFGLRGALEPGAGTSTLRRAVEWVAPALEITDSRYLPGDRSAVELISDNTSSAAYVIGERVPLGESPPLDAIQTQIVRNGTVLAAGSSADVLGDPTIALGLLAEHLASRGLRTVAGDIVMSGAITDAFPAAPGDVFEARLASFDAARVGFV